MYLLLVFEMFMLQQMSRNSKHVVFAKICSFDHSCGFHFMYKVPQQIREQICTTLKQHHRMIVVGENNISYQQPAAHGSVFHSTEHRERIAFKLDQSCTISDSENIDNRGFQTVVI
jgi:hypothetical protein